MTNIIATVIAVLATNWITVSRTTPIYNDPPGVTYAVMRYNSLNQVGTVVTNYMARVVWRGRTNEFLLESAEVAGRDKLSRSVPDDAMVR